MLREISNLRKALRTQRNSEETSQAYEAALMLHLGLPGVEEPSYKRADEGELETLARERLSRAKKGVRKILETHDKDRRVRRTRHFRYMLETNPKKAHRYIFESGEQKPLDHVKLSTGEVSVDPERVIQEVERVYGERQKPVVDPQDARRFPWDAGRATGDTLIRSSGGGTDKISERYNKHVFKDCMSRLPGWKAPGPDGVPNEVIKMMPQNFHEALHTLFTMMLAEGVTPDQWKDDVTVLLYKKGDPGKVENHRWEGDRFPTYYPRTRIGTSGWK